MVMSRYLTACAVLASPRARGEAGLHRRCNPGEGDSPRTVLAERAPHPDPLPVKDGERERTAADVAARLLLAKMCAPTGTPKETTAWLS
ncbi:hypothetical protein S58_52980 [Bradyrhizobium oligotrophicum S58]|uniref:Uncharacterized protein n=1 Tax=Bradyrhizobium oligotrophicum S58 TaxID=1245469 RepID=M4ZC04_9BRAD|nr:hypothetical protein S58_52980 [Bradyrhizobium oligotrophicum S58]